MRLIDADEFKRQIAAVVIKNGTSKSVDKANVLFDSIDLQPTAYNVEKVVQQLKQDIDNCSEEDLDNCKNTTCRKCRFERINRIVRNGGRNRYGTVL